MQKEKERCKYRLGHVRVLSLSHVFFIRALIVIEFWLEIRVFQIIHVPVYIILIGLNVLYSFGAGWYVINIAFD